MEIKFLGTGGAFDFEYGNSSAFITLNNERILLDCGNSVYSTLRRKKLINVFDYLLITHLHDDHCGSLSSIILHRMIFNKKKLKLLYPQQKFREELTNFLSHSLNDVEKYVEFVPFGEFPGIGFLNTFGKHLPWMQTYGYYFEDEGNRLVYSGDLGNADFIFSQLKKLVPKKTTVFHDISFEQNKAHTYYHELMKNSRDWQIFGYHCDPSQNPGDNTIPLVQNKPELVL